MRNRLMFVLAFVCSVGVVLCTLQLASAQYTRETGTVPEMNNQASSAGSSATKAKTAAADKIDINSATKEQLDALPGIGEAYSQKIIANRPYRTKRDLVTRKIIPQSTYEKIKDQIIAHKEHCDYNQEIAGRPYVSFS